MMAACATAARYVARGAHQRCDKTAQCDARNLEDVSSNRTNDRFKNNPPTLS